MKINLNGCKPGDKVVLRNGDIGAYEGKLGGDKEVYPHTVTFDDQVDCGEYTNEGSFWSHGGVSKFDIVAVIDKADIDEDDMSELFSIIPDGVTEFVYNGKRYKQEFSWVESSE